MWEKNRILHRSFCILFINGLYSRSIFWCCRYYRGILSIALLIMAIASKIIGCGVGAKMCGYSNKECLQIGTGMVSRGEVALIVASKGSVLGLISAQLFAPIVIMVVVTTIITPILLKLVFREKKAVKHVKGASVA